MPPATNLASQHYELVRPGGAELGVDAAFAAVGSAHAHSVLGVSARLRVASARDGRDQGGVAAKRAAKRVSPIDNHVQATAVVSRDVCRRVGQPLLWDDPALGPNGLPRNAHPRALQRFGTTLE